MGLFSSLGHTGLEALDVVSRAMGYPGGQLRVGTQKALRAAGWESGARALEGAAPRLIFEQLPFLAAALALEVGTGGAATPVLAGRAPWLARGLGATRFLVGTPKQELAVGAGMVAGHELGKRTPLGPTAGTLLGGLAAPMAAERVSLRAAPRAALAKEGEEAAETVAKEASARTDHAGKMKRGDFQPHPLELQSIEEHMRSWLQTRVPRGTFANGPLGFIVRNTIGRAFPSLVVRPGTPRAVAMDIFNRLELADQGLALLLFDMYERERSVLARIAPRGGRDLTLDTKLAVKGTAEGLPGTVRDVLERPQLYQLDDETRGLVNAYHENTRQIREAAASILKGLGKTDQEIEKILPVLREQGDKLYVHRVAVRDITGTPFAQVGARRFGLSQPFTKERVPEELLKGITYAGQPTAILHSYADEVFSTVLLHQVAEELKLLGERAPDVATLVPVEIIDQLHLAGDQMSWLRKAHKLATGVASGAVTPAQAAARLKPLLEAENVPSEWMDAVLRLVPEPVLKDRLPELARQAPTRVARYFEGPATSKALAAAERVGGSAAVAQVRWQSEEAWRRMAKEVGRTLRGYKGRLPSMVKAGEIMPDAAKVVDRWLGEAIQLVRATRATGDTTEAQELVRQLLTRTPLQLPGGWGEDLVNLMTRPVAEGPGGSAVYREAERAAAAVVEALGPESPARQTLQAYAEKLAEEATKFRAGKEAAKIFKKAGRLARDELAYHSELHKVVLRDAADQVRLARVVAVGRDFALPDFLQFAPANRVYLRKKWVDELNRIYASYAESVRGPLRVVNDISAIATGFQAGSLDIGQLTLHAAALLNPMHWPLLLRVYGPSTWTDSAYVRAIAKMKQRQFADGTPVLDALAKAGLRIYSEPLAPQTALAADRGAMRKVADFTANIPANKLFSRQVNMTRLLLAENSIRMVEKMAGRALTDAERADIVRVTGMATGDFNWTRAGASHVTRAVSRAGGRYAPTWLLANLDLLATALTPSMKVDAQMARYYLASIAAGTVGMYVGIAHALKETPDLDPRSPNFLSIKVGGVKMGPGGALRAFVRTAAEASDLARRTAEGDSEAARELFELKRTGGPLRRFYRTGAPIFAGLLYDAALEGHQLYVDKPLSFGTREEAKETLEGFAMRVLPFTLQDLISGGPEQAAASFLGWRSYPVSPAEQFLDTANKKAQELGYSGWRAVPKGTQAELRRNDPELAQLYQEREQYFRRWGGDAAKRQEQLEREQRLMESSLLAAWGRVETGGMSVADWRRMLVEMRTRYLSWENALLYPDGAPTTEEAPRKDEAIQDYYARIYYSIQPDLYDANRDGYIDDTEWSAWSQARREFWQRYPQAQRYRDYITVTYRQQAWDDPQMAELAGQYYDALDRYQHVLDMPKYRLLSREQGEFVDKVRSLKNAVQEELRFRLQQRLPPAVAEKVKIPKRAVWLVTLRLLQLEEPNMVPEDVTLLKLGIAFDDEDVRTRFLNPERIGYVMGNSDLVEWYPGVVKQLGVPSDLAAYLGVTQQASGEPPAALAQQAVDMLHGPSHNLP